MPADLLLTVSFVFCTIALAVLIYGATSDTFTWRGARWGVYAALLLFCFHLVMALVDKLRRAAERLSWAHAVALKAKQTGRWPRG